MSRIRPHRRLDLPTRSRTAPPARGAPGGSVPPGAPLRVSPRVALGVVALAVIVAVVVRVYAWQGASGSSGEVVASADGAPVYQIVEGQAGYDYPYDPEVLQAKAGHPFVVRLVDNLGGCGLVTVFHGLGQSGGTATVNVPVGSSRDVTLEAPHAGTYVYNCGSDMYFGKIVAA